MAKLKESYEAFVASHSCTVENSMELLSQRRLQRIKLHVIAGHEAICAQCFNQFKFLQHRLLRKPRNVGLLLIMLHDLHQHVCNNFIAFIRRMQTIVSHINCINRVRVFISCRVKWHINK